MDTKREIEQQKITTEVAEKNVVIFTFHSNPITFCHSMVTNIKTKGTMDSVDWFKCCLNLSSKTNK